MMQAVSESRGRLHLRDACGAIGLARSSYYRRLRPAVAGKARRVPRALDTCKKREVLELVEGRAFRGTRAC